VKIDEHNFTEQIKKENAKALEFVVENYSNLVFKVVRTVLNSNFHSQNADECVNDVFWAVWNNIKSFDYEKGNFKYWITAIAKYKAIDYKRKLFEKGKNKCLDECDFRSEINVENILISKENKQEVLTAINTLKPDDREIFIRRYFLYEKVEDIAKIFGIDRNVVDKRLSRGRKSLKAKLMPLKGEVI